MKRLQALILFILLSLSPPVLRAKESSVPAENLQALVTAAITNNPEVKASEARWQMFKSRVKLASAPEETMVMLKMQSVPVRNPLLFNQDPQSAKVIGISHALPFWGKKALRTEVAQHEADSYRWAMEERRLELTRMVRETYYQLWAVDKELKIIDKNLKILSDFVTITELKYSINQGVQQDIFKAGLEKSRMIKMQLTLQQQRSSLEANLNYLLARPGNTPVGTIADFTLPMITIPAAELNVLAMQHRPQMKSLASLFEKAKASRRLADKERWPDFNLSVEYMLREAVSTPMATDPGDNMVSAGVTFNLPFLTNKRHAMQAESTFESSMATEELHALKNTISYTIQETLAQLERRHSEIELYKKGIIPQAEHALESALISYRVNKVDFLSLLDARISLFNNERELYDSEAEYMMKLAQLEATIGTEITAAPSTLLKTSTAGPDEFSRNHSH